jgi:aryl-alcohol dehydrogenase-like predicted oxidoreductase
VRYLTFGRRTGLRVSELALGTANFGTGCGSDPDAAKLIWGRRGDGAAVDAAREMFERFAAAGGTLIDTADCYQFGQAETLLGDLLGAERDHFVVATKFTNGSSPRPDVSVTGNSRKAMRSAVEASLRRLRTDHLDVLWAHFPDPGTPLEELLIGFDDLVRAGKVLYAGLSNFPAWQVARAATIAELRGSTPLIGLQTEYSLVQRTPDRELLPMAADLGLGTAAWSPLAGGLLTGRYRRTPEGWVSSGNRRVIPLGDGDTRARVLVALASVADECDVSPARVAIAWLLARAEALDAPIVPIIGPRTVEQLDDYLAALTLPLTGEQLARLDRAGAVALGAPHEVNVAASGAVAGGDAERLLLRTGRR